MKGRYVIAVLIVFFQFSILAGCSKKESNNTELASVNGEIILQSDLDLAKSQYESKTMSNAELLDGLIKERIVLQHYEGKENVITEEDVEKSIQTLKGEQNGNIFYKKALEEYGSEEAVKTAMKNRMIYNFVKDDLMNQFLSSLLIDMEKLYFRTEDFVMQCDMDMLDDSEKGDYIEAVFTQYRDSLTNELFDLFFQVWLNKQIRSSDIEYLSNIEQLSNWKKIQVSGDSVLIDQEKELLRNITFAEAQEVYGNFLCISNEMAEYDGLKIYGYHDTKEQIKVLRIDYIEEGKGMLVSISLIVSPDLVMGDERVISENYGLNVVEYNMPQIGARYSIGSSLEVGAAEEILNRLIPYTLQ